MLDTPTPDEIIAALLAETGSSGTMATENAEAMHGRFLADFLARCQDILHQPLTFVVLTEARKRYEQLRWDRDFYPPCDHREVQANIDSCKRLIAQATTYHTWPIAGLNDQTAAMFQGGALTLAALLKRQPSIVLMHFF